MKCLESWGLCQCRELGGQQLPAFVHVHRKAGSRVEARFIRPRRALAALRVRVRVSVSSWGGSEPAPLPIAPFSPWAGVDINQTIPLKCSGKIVPSLALVTAERNLLEFSAEETGTVVSCTFARHEAEPFYSMSHCFLSPYYGFSYLSLHNIPQSTLLEHRPDAADPLGTELLLAPTGTEIPPPTAGFSASSLHPPRASGGLLRQCLSDGQETCELQ